MAIVLETTIEGQYTVTLRESGSGAARFRVDYGKHVADYLTYAKAAKEYGECVFHALACAGMISNK